MPDEANTIARPERNQGVNMADNVQLDVETGENVSLEDLHNQMTGIISGTSLIHLAAESREEALADIHAEMSMADDETKELLQRQLDALELLSKLAKDEGRKTADRFLARKDFDHDQSAILLKYLQDTTQASEVLGDRLGVTLENILGDYAAKIGNRKLDATFRMELLKEFVQEGGGALPSSKAFKDIAAAVESGVDLGSRKSTKAMAKMVQKAIMDVQQAGSVHDLAKQLAESSLTEEESLAELKRLGSLLEEMDGFAEEQTRLAELSKDDVAKNTENIVDLKKVLWKLADETTETKTLHTLNQIEHKFDKSILTSDELGESLKANSLGKTFADNPGGVSKGGKSLAQAIANMAGQSWWGQLAETTGIGDGDFGLGDLVAYTGVGKGLSWLKNKFKGAGSAITGGLGRTGKSIASGVGRGLSMTPLPGVAGRIGKTTGRALERVARSPVGRGLEKATQNKVVRATGSGVGKVVRSGLSKAGQLVKRNPKRAALGGAIGGGYLLFRGDDDRPEATVVTEQSSDALSREATVVPQESMVDVTTLPPDDLMEFIDKEDSLSDDVGVGLGGATLGGAGIYGAERASSAVQKKALQRNPRLLEKRGMKAAKAAARTASAPTGGIKGIAKGITKSSVGKVAGRAAGPAFAVAELLMAENQRERTAALGGLAGASAGAAAAGLLGAAAGSVVPVAGTIIGGVVGTAVGGALGYFGGERLVTGLFTDAVDKIPDKVKNLGPLVEDAYVGMLLDNGHWGDNDPEDPESVPTPLSLDDVKELSEHRRELLTPEYINKWLKTSDIDDMEEDKRVPALEEMLNSYGVDEKTRGLFHKEAAKVWRKRTTMEKIGGVVEKIPLLGAFGTMMKLAGKPSDMDLPEKTRTTLPGMSGRSTERTTLPGMSGRSTERTTLPGMSGRSTERTTLPGMSGRSTERTTLPGMSGTATPEMTQTVTEIPPRAPMSGMRGMSIPERDGRNRPMPRQMPQMPPTSADGKSGQGGGGSPPDEFGIALSRNMLFN